MSLNLLHVEGNSEKLRRIVRSHKIRSIFYTEKTQRKPKDRVATEDKNNIVYKNDCSNCEAVYFGEFKRSLKSRSDEYKRSVRNAIVIRMELLNTAGKQITTLTGIKETIHSLKNPNHIIKTFYMLPEIWLANLQQFLLTYLCHICGF